MSSEITLELKNFLRSANLSNYEITAYITLLMSNNLTARELSEKSKVPTGRIYEVLDVLKDKGMIEIQDSRPKIYRAITFSEASHSIISHIKSPFLATIRIYRMDILVLADENGSIRSNNY